MENNEHRQRHLEKEEETQKRGGGTEITIQSTANTSMTAHGRYRHIQHKLPVFITKENSVEKDLVACNAKASIFPRRNQNSQHCGL